MMGSQQSRGSVGDPKRRGARPRARATHAGQLGFLLAGVLLLAACGAEPTLITITPPTSLTLDGQPVTSGQFVVSSATAYRQSGDRLLGMVVEPDGGFPVTVDATIGQGSHDLFSVPKDTKALDVSGNFDATSPDLDPANYNLTLFADFSQPVEMTVFLAQSTSETMNQFTGSPANGGESTNVLTDDDISPDAYANVIESAGDDPGNVNTSLFPLNVPVTSVSWTAHGSLRLVPATGSDGFACGNGSSVSPDVVCNGTQDCPDGSDEDPATCSDESSCCVATNGCPGETGSSCADSCCCCPGGQACSQTNPASGCVATN